ncbi:hypothetical protein PAXRUDRAFT_44408, partial [Paxillus rubicundulus Ve08.2h10]
PIIYMHIHIMHSIVSSQYLPQTDASHQVSAWARPLGKTAAHYLAAHGYGISDVDTIIQLCRQATSREQFVMLLAA